MCPIYSVTSWLSLVIPTMEGYLGIFKDLYEAYVIYQFLSFCIAVLGKGDRGAVVALLARHADHLSPPVRCFGWCRKKRHQLSGDGDSVGGAGDGVGGDDEEREQEEEEEHHKQLADDVLMQCQVFAMQFVFLRPMLTAALFVLKKMDYYGPMFGAIHFHVGNFTIGNDLVMDEDGNFEDDTSGMGSMGYRSPQFYIMILENVSVFLAFSGLLKFYHAVQEDLSW